MNKKEFLKELEKRLKVLSEEEKKDICNEYEDIIDEKVKHGKTEEEAVKEFGDVASLSKEILKSYKINPEYKNTTNDFLGDCEDLIKKGAKKLGDVTEEVIESFKKSDTETTLENIFEIIIKVFILLVAVAILHIPFWLIGEFGSVFLSEFSFFSNMNPLQNVVCSLWKFLAEVAYIIVCVLLAIAIFKKYFNSKENVVKLEKKESIKEKKIDVKKTNTKAKMNESSKNNTKETGKKDSLSKLLITLLKIWICLLFIMPLVFIQIGLLITICIIIYLLTKGVEIYGITILIVGASLFVGHLIKVLINGLFSKKKIYFWPFVISFMMIIIGTIFTVDYIFSFTYNDDLEKSGYNLERKIYDINIKDSLDTYYDDLLIDNSMEDDHVKFEVTYYSNFAKIDVTEYTETICSDECTLRTNYYIHTNLIEHRSINDLLNDTIIKHLKEKKVYDYSELLDINIRIIANEKTIEKIN